MGRNQRDVLRALARHGGSWPGGWYWTNASTTVKILNSLVKRGLVSVHGRVETNRSYDEYRITDNGKAVIEIIGKS